jgi:small-conductance mechanosensitive channel
MTTFNLDATSFSDPIVDGVNRLIPQATSVFFGLLVGILVIRITVRILRFILKLTQIPLGLRGIIASVVQIMLWLMLTIVALKSLGFSDVVTFFSSSALAIGILLAAGGSTLLSDIIAGIFLARDGDFNVGDEVIAGENQTQGIIESMDARRTRIRDKKGVLHIIPNSVVERKEWVLVHKNEELTALVKAVKTAKKFREAALEKRAAVQGKRALIRKNDQ